MNQNNNIFNENKIKNELKNFQEGSDYSVVPTADPNIKTYNFHNDKLRSVFRGDKVPVRITQEAYDGKDYTYRGHFEEGKDYYYSSQTWTGKDWNGGQRANINNQTGDYYREWWQGWKTERPKIMPEMSGFSDNFFTDIGREIEKEKGYNNNKPAGCCNCGFNDIRPSDDYCQKCGALLCDEVKSAKTDLRKENHELRQQLSQVQKQLAEVLAELKKLKSNINGKSSEKLNRQIIRNERLIENGGSVSETEVRDQINKSEALMKEFNTTVEPTKKDNSLSPYLIGGSIILVAAGIIGCLLWKKKWRK